MARHQAPPSSKPNRCAARLALAIAIFTPQLSGSDSPPLSARPGAPQSVVARPAANALLHGFTEPAESIDVAAAETGTLESVAVELGQAVRKGELLARLDSQVLAATLTLAEAKVASTARRDAAEIELARLQRRVQSLRVVMEKGHARANELDNAESQVAVSETELRQAEEQQLLDRFEMERIEAQIERRTIRSPIDGLVTRIHKKLGEFVASTEPQIATIVRLNQLRMRFYLSTDQAIRFSVGDRVPVALGYPEQRTEARVKYVAPVTDSQSGTVHVELILDNADGKYRSGVPCRLLLEHEARASVGTTSGPNFRH